MTYSQVSSVSRRVTPAKDLKMNREKSKMTISPNESKLNFSQKFSYSKIRRDSMTKLDEKVSFRNKISNFDSNIVYINNNPTAETARKLTNESKPMMKIKNFFESTKINTLQSDKVALSERYNQMERVGNKTTVKKQK